MNRSILAAMAAFLAVARASGADVVAAYPAGEADRQFAILAHDLAGRAAFAAKADRDPLDVLLRRTEALLADLRQKGAQDLAASATELAALKAEAEKVDPKEAAARRALFDRVLPVRRRIAFANPLLDFKDLVFVKRHRAIYEHMCDQFYGIAARPGGGLFVLRDAFGPNPQARDLLANAAVENGRLKGQRLFGGNGAGKRLSYDGEVNLSGDETTGGAFLSPELSYDAKRLLFAYCECSGRRSQEIHTDATRGHWDAGRCYHVFGVNLDGTDLRQLTDGTWNEFDPCWLPNGRVAFISERRGGYLRCGRACPLYNLYDMDPDGGGINLLSFHDSNEWNPSVTHDGRIVWTRWDYIDRHGCVAHVPWITRLDGTDPRALHGNFSTRNRRADMELGVRAIPGSQKFIATAAPHHGQAFGSLIVIDPRVPDDDAMGPVKRMTPDVGFPESQSGHQVYGTPWPLGEDYALCTYDPAMNGSVKPRAPHGDYGLYLVDAFGNKELVYRDAEIGSMSPVPLRLTAPQAVTRAPTATDAGKAVKPGDAGEGTMAVLDVYNTLKPWPTNAHIKELRILQVLPCSVPSGGKAPHQTGKRVAEAGDSIVPARWVLGTVPVEADGSAYFKVPAYRELFFQLVDERGLAVQSMRSGTAIRDGEKLVCAGCHEPKCTSPTITGPLPLAMRRAPSEPKPDVEGSNPFSYPRLVQPVLDAKCVACHVEKKALNLARDPIQNKFYASYNNLMKFSFTAYGDWCRTVPGKFGAQASPLIALLEKGHYDVKLTPEEFHRFTLWQDCLSMFYGVFEKEPGEAQLRGEPGRPTLE